MDREKLNEILTNHLHWLNKDCDGWETMRADLRRADLWGADLRGANLLGADLLDADLRGADLRGANLLGANLLDADLRDTNLRRADLRGANLLGADLRRADLRRADLRRADLRRADLRDANLLGADLLDADLRRANLWGADLRDADLREAVNVPFIPISCPDEGAFVGWKKANGCIVKLLIPEDAKRLSATGRKCRCDKAVVLSIEDLGGEVHDKPEKDFYAVSDHDSKFIYRVGETVSVDNFCEERFKECAPGIHFFINKQEAINY